MLLIVEKSIIGEIFHAIHQYAKVNNKYISAYDKNKKLWQYLKYWDTNNLNGQQVSQKLPVKHFEWMEDLIKVS